MHCGIVVQNASVGRRNCEPLEIRLSTKSFTVQYRYVKLDGLWETFSLKSMVVDILRRTPKGGGEKLLSMARLRKKDLDQDGSFVLLNKISDEGSWDGDLFCGQLIHVKSGTELPGLNGSLDDDLKEFELQNLTLEQRAQIVEGVLYFAVMGNHVGIIEGQRTRGRTLERYLTRLLQDAGELEPGSTIIMNAKLEGSVSKVKEIDVAPQRSMAPYREGETSTEAAESEGEGTTVLDVLRLLGWDDEQIEQLENSIPQEGWLEGIFKVKFKRKRGRAASVDREVLEEALRNLDAHSVGLLGDGAKEKGGLIKLSEKCKIKSTGELLDPDDAMQQIVACLRRWAKTGKIDYTPEG